MLETSFSRRYHQTCHHRSRPETTLRHHVGQHATRATCFGLTLVKCEVEGLLSGLFANIWAKPSTPFQFLTSCTWAHTNVPHVGACMHVHAREHAKPLNSPIPFHIDIGVFYTCMPAVRHGTAGEEEGQGRKGPESHSKNFCSHSCTAVRWSNPVQH